MLFEAAVIGSAKTSIPGSLEGYRGLPHITRGIIQ